MVLKRDCIVCMTNHVKANISYQHRQEIQRTFREIIQGELCIDHFSINVFFGDNESMFFSPTPQMAEELCKKNFVTVDSNYKRSIYKKYSMYSWRSVAQNEVDVAINHIKEDKYGLRSGMMIVRDLGDNRYAMYSFATRKKETMPGLFHFLFHSKANYIAQMGDYMYNELNYIINEYAVEEDVTMPKIDLFKEIKVEHALYNDHQKEWMSDIQENKTKSFLQSMEGKSAQILKLVEQGRMIR